MNAMRRLAVCLTLAAVASGCVGATPPTPLIVYVTPAPSAVSVPSPAPSRPEGPGYFDSVTGKWVPLPPPHVEEDSTPAPAPTPTPTPAPTREPTPTPLLPITENELVAVCKGKPIPHAAKYAGAVHPLVVVSERWGIDSDYAINAKWRDSRWPGRIQLVVCRPDEATAVKVGSCGTYTRKSDGEVGEIVRYKYTEKIRVVVARTGRQTGYKTLAGSIPTCAASLSIPASGPPPWDYYGDYPSVDAVDEYATAVSRQKVE
jgi:hypothetical protein